MSKTLSLKKLDVSLPPEAAVQVEPETVLPSVQGYTAEQLLAMLAAMGVNAVVPTARVMDPTMDLSIDGLAPHEIADKSKLPPVDERQGGAVQVASGVHGRFGLNGIPLIAPGVDLNQSINPATGQPYAQAGIRPVTQIQAPPQNFGRRRG